MKESHGIQCHSDGGHKEAQPMSFTTKDFHNSTVHSDDSLTAPKLFQPDSHLYTDKEINHPVVKDICVDEGVPIEDKGLVQTQTKELASKPVSVPSNECRQDEISEEGDPFVADCANKDMPIPEDSRLSGETTHNTPKKIENDILEEENQSPSMEANAESFAALSKAEDLNKNGSKSGLVHDHKFENGTTIFDFNLSKHATAESVVKSAEAIEPSLKSDDVMNQEGNTNVLPPAGLVQDADMARKVKDSCQESAANIPSRNFNNPFINSEIPSTTGETAKNFNEEMAVNQTKDHSNNPFAFEEDESSSVEPSSGNIHQSHIMNHEKGNFNPFEYDEFESANVHQPPTSNPFNRNSKNPFDSMDLDHDTRKITNPFADDRVRSSSFPGAIENIHQQPELKQNDGHSSNPFATSEVSSVRLDAISANMNENPLKTETRTGSDEHLSSSNLNPSAAASVKPPDLRNGELSSANVSSNNHIQSGIGESSFSAAGPPSGLITYSGPIAYSGSISLRSDSSATSTRSFAFPVLQNEWNSSPVRMRKADRRDLRKHKGWQGILCCKF